jgi:peroxiredoxin Q/BCP
MTEIDAADAVVLGCSPDDEASHQAFRDKFELNFPLLVDTELVALTAYDAYGEKTLYGKTSIGVTRKTYIIDKAGKIAKVWKRVTPEGHADKVLEALAAIA